MLAGKTVLLCVSGSIAAYKIAYLASALKKLKADVQMCIRDSPRPQWNRIVLSR